MTISKSNTILLKIKLQVLLTRKTCAALNRFFNLFFNMK